MECYALISVAKKKFQRSREVNTYISDRAIDKYPAWPVYRLGTAAT